MSVEIFKDVLMLGFPDPILEGFPVVSATHSPSRGCQSCVQFVVALCLGLFPIVVTAKTMSCLVWFVTRLFSAQGVSKKANTEILCIARF